MNIFYLDSNPVLAARAHCDKHVNKMAFEGAQMLCTAVRYLIPAWHRAPKEHLLYAPTHDNHPCSIWVRQNWHNAKGAIARWERGTPAPDWWAQLNAI